jgi:hypothetical protein
MAAVDRNVVVPFTALYLRGDAAAEELLWGVGAPAAETSNKATAAAIDPTAAPATTAAATAGAGPTADTGVAADVYCPPVHH